MDYNLTPDGHDGFVMRPRSAADAQWDGTQQIAKAGRGHPQSNPAAGLAGIAVGAAVGYALGSAYERAQPTTRLRIKAGLWALLAYIGFASLFSSESSIWGRLVGAAFGLAFGALAVRCLLRARARTAPSTRLSRLQYAATQTEKLVEERTSVLRSAINSDRAVWLGVIWGSQQVEFRTVWPLELQHEKLISRSLAGEELESSLSGIVWAEQDTGPAYGCCEQCSCGDDPRVFHREQCAVGDRTRYF